MFLNFLVTDMCRKKTRGASGSILGAALQHS